MFQKDVFYLSCLVLLCIILSCISTECKINDAHSLPNQHITPEELKSYLTKLLSRNDSFMSCPAPTLPVEDADCSSHSCTTDQDCAQKNQSCCFNGCIFTCMDKISPPPIIDYDEEPDSTPIREEGGAVLRCTTSPRPAPSEPVGCPKGYICKLDDFGNPLEGRYNSGVCVPDTTPPEIEDTENKEYAELKENTRKQTVYLPGGCVLNEAQYKHMKEFMARSYVSDCLCVQGSIECQISA